MPTDQILTLILVLTCIFTVAAMFTIGAFVEGDGRRVLLLLLNLIIAMAIIIPVTMQMN